MRVFNNILGELRANFLSKQYNLVIPDLGHWNIDLAIIRCLQWLNRTCLADVSGEHDNGNLLNYFSVAPSRLSCSMHAVLVQYMVMRIKYISYRHRRDHNKTVLLRDTVHQISRGESAAAGQTAVLFLSRDVKNTKFNQYLPVDSTSLNVFNSRFRKPVMFWR